MGNVSPLACIPGRLTIVTTGEFFNRIGPDAAFLICAQMQFYLSRLANDSNTEDFVAPTIQMLLPHGSQNFFDPYKCEAHRTIGDAVRQEEVISNADCSTSVDDVGNITFAVFVSSR
jgi:hypothetical protein